MGGLWLGTFECRRGQSQSLEQASGAAHNRVVYIQLDTPRSLWLDRIERLRLTGLPVDPLLFADRETLDTWPFDITQDEHFELLRGSLAACAPDCVIIDTLREAHSRDENDSTEMQRVVARLTAAVYPAALVLVAHSKKPSYDQGPSTINDMRGSSYIPGKMDGIVRFSKDGISVAGRAVEEQDIKLERRANHTWTLSEREMTRNMAIRLLKDTDKSSLREKARKLAVMSGKSEDSCLSLLHRIASTGDIT
jgi:hypothetical protein